MIRDALGRTFEFAQPPRRVVSLVPSLTETLFQIGAGDVIAGVTSFCIFPPNDRPKLGGTKTPKIEAIRELRPDLVYVNVEENLRRHAEAIEQFAPVFATEPKSVAGVIDLITTVGQIHNQSDRASRLADEIRTELARTGDSAFTFACAIWKNPWMWCGGDTYVSNLVSAAGGRNVLAGESRYPSCIVAEVVALKPEVIFLPDEPFPFREEDAAALRAAGATKVIGPFPGHLVTWHGARTLLGLRFLSNLRSGATGAEKIRSGTEPDP